MEKSCRKCTLKASPIPFLNFAKQAKIALARKKFFLKKGILKEDYQTALKKLTLFFPLNPVAFNGQSYQKQLEVVFELVWN